MAKYPKSYVAYLLDRAREIRQSFQNRILLICKIEPEK